MPMQCASNRISPHDCLQINFMVVISAHTDQSLTWSLTCPHQQRWRLHDELRCFVFEPIQKRHLLFQGTQLHGLIQHITFPAEEPAA